MTPEILVNSEAKETNGSAPIVYMTGTIPTPQYAFALYLNREMGMLHRDFQIVPSLEVTSDNVSPEFISFSISQPGMKNRLHAMINQLEEAENMSHKKKETLGKIANYMGVVHTAGIVTEEEAPLHKLSSVGASARFYDKMLVASLRHIGNPKEALKAQMQTIDYFVNNNLDPYIFMEEKPLTHDEIRERTQYLNRLHDLTIFRLAELEKVGNQGSKIKFMLPTCQDTNDAPKIERALGRLRMIDGEKVSVVIVGPSHSGKSTLSASLSVEINKILGEAKDMFDYSDLLIKCVVVDLDKSTPDISRILENDTSAQRDKVKWTPVLALEAATDFLRKESGIIIADAPGGDPDHITDVVVNPADLGMLLVDSKRWKEMSGPWLDALKGIGVKPIAQVKSIKHDEADQIIGKETRSTITSYDKDGETGWITEFGGEIAGLNLQVLEDNEFIKQAARVLVFDVIPQVVIERKKRESDYLRKLYFDYINEYARVD